MPELAGVPTEPVTVPPGLRRALEKQGMRQALLVPAWQNTAGGLTFSVTTGGAGPAPDYFAKWNPLASGESLAGEAERLRWIDGKHPAPRVFALVANATEEVLITEALPGESAVAQVWKKIVRGSRFAHSVPGSVSCMSCPSLAAPSIGASRSAYLLLALTLPRSGRRRLLIDSSCVTAILAPQTPC